MQTLPGPRPIQPVHMRATLSNNHHRDAALKTQLFELVDEYGLANIIHAVASLLNVLNEETGDAVGDIATYIEELETHEGAQYTSSDFITEDPS